MSRYVITLDANIDFAPQTITAEVLQNVRTIFATRIGTVPLDRDFGLSWDNIDKPYPVAKSLMMVDVIEAVESQEPRAHVVSVTFDESEKSVMEGLLKPRVIVEIDEEGGG